MTETLTLILAISGLLVGLCGAGVVFVLLSAAVWQLFPRSAVSIWLRAEVFPVVDAQSIKVGDCLKPSGRKAGTFRHVDIMVGGVSCDE